MHKVDLKLIVASSAFILEKKENLLFKKSAGHFRSRMIFNRTTFVEPRRKGYLPSRVIKSLVNYLRPTGRFAIESLK